jgi:hypothetical protein
MLEDQRDREKKNKEKNNRESGLELDALMTSLGEKRCASC